jgi:hypothetical protein
VNQAGCSSGFFLRPAMRYPEKRDAPCWSLLLIPMVTLDLPDASRGLTACGHRRLLFGTASPRQGRPVHSGL